MASLTLRSPSFPGPGRATTHPPPPAPVIFAPGLPAPSAAAASASAASVETPIRESSSWPSDMHLPSADLSRPARARSARREIPADSSAIAPNSVLLHSLKLDTAATIAAVECGLPVSATTRRSRPAPSSGLHPPSMLYAPNPPRAQAAVSMPDAMPNAPLSASRAAASAPAASSPSPTAARTAAAAATHHADDAPRPDPSGTLLSTATHRPAPAPRAARTAMPHTAASGAGRPPGMSSPSRTSQAGQTCDSTRTTSSRRGSTDALAPLPMAHAMAGAPCTTKCSPDSMALPGALARAGRTAASVICRTLPTRTRRRTTRRRRRRQS